MREIESKEKELAFLIEKRDLDQGQHAVIIANRIKEVRRKRKKRSIEESFEKKARQSQICAEDETVEKRISGAATQGPSQSSKGNEGDDNDGQICHINSN